MVAAAAMFGGVGMAQAAALKEQQQRGGAAGDSRAAAAAAATTTTTSATSATASASPGARDLGMLLAEAPSDQSSDPAAEEKERARKLAEVRRIKAERQAAGSQSVPFTPPF